MSTKKNVPPGQKPASTVSPWTYLSWFQVQYLSSPQDNKTAKVFSNNRQQVHIEIVLEGRNANGEVTTIPREDFLRLELVRYETGETLFYLVSTAFSKDARFDYYPESGAFPTGYLVSALTNTEHHVDSGLDNSQYTNTETVINVRTENIAHPSGIYIQAQIYDIWISTDHPDTLRIAAKLTAPNGTIFHTHTQTAAPGGGPTGGKFNSSLTLSPQPPRRFAAEYFSIRQRNEINNQYFDVDIYEIWLKDLSYKIRDSIHHTRPEDQWHYSWEKNSRNQYQYAYRADHLRLVRHTTVGAPLRYIEFLVNYFLASEGKATASRVTETYWLGTFNSGGPARVGYIDNFGNESIIALKPSDDGNTMSITD
jgi:hypothetical protein